MLVLLLVGLFRGCCNDKKKQVKGCVKLIEQALNEFVDNLEQIEKKYAEPHEKRGKQMMKCKADCSFNFDGKCTKQSKKDMTVIEKWKNDFKGFINELSMPKDDYNGIMQYIDEAPNEPRWIPVSERLPKKSGNYWCTFGGTNLTGSDYYTTESDAKEIFDDPEEYVGWRSQNVIAWMPLPASYKESGDNEVDS